MRVGALCGLAKEWNVALINRLSDTLHPDSIIIAMPRGARIPHSLAARPITLLHDPPQLPLERIARLATLRNLYANLERDVRGLVVMVDFDIGLPTTSLPFLLAAVNKIRSGLWDVICANGQHKNSRFYYDGTATILRDGTFAYPSIWQMHRQPRERTTLASTTHHFNHTRRLIDVRSCFGGLAIYRSLKSCSYSHHTYTNYTRYAYANKRVCEHIPFHHCLTIQHDRIAVHNRLITLWNAT